MNGKVGDQLSCPLRFWKENPALADLKAIALDTGVPGVSAAPEFGASGLAFLPTG